MCEIWWRYVKTFVIYTRSSIRIHTLIHTNRQMNILAKMHILVGNKCILYRTCHAKCLMASWPISKPEIEIILTKLSLLAVPDVKMNTGAICDENFIRMPAFPFHCITLLLSSHSIYAALMSLEQLCPCHHDIHIDGLVQERCNSIANAMELHLSCINPSICKCVLKASYKTTVSPMP